VILRGRVRAPVGNRGDERRLVESLDDDIRPFVEHGDRDRPEPARDELVVRAIVLVDVVGRERHAFA